MWLTHQATHWATVQLDSSKNRAIRRTVRLTGDSRRLSAMTNADYWCTDASLAQLCRYGLAFYVFLCASVCEYKKFALYIACIETVCGLHRVLLDALWVCFGIN